MESNASKKRVLLIGGTGAIGTYLAPELASRGFDVFVTSRSERESTTEGITYVQGNARVDEAFMEEQLRQHYDAIVDFMVYNTGGFKNRYEQFLDSTDHYVFLSSYRVFADAGMTPLTEESPRLFDVVDDPDYRATDEYALTKARQEELLHRSERTNFTIVRPAITYSKERFQLGTMEAREFIGKAVCGKAVPFAEEMLDKQTTMSWAGDVAKMIAPLVLNEAAFGETFIVSTAEHHSWREIIDIYHEQIGLTVKPVPLKKYQNKIGRPWQIKYDRMYDRIVDNSKILAFTGLKQSDFLPLKDGLSRELEQFLSDPSEKTKELIKHGGDSALKTHFRNFVRYCRNGVLLRAINNRLFRIPAYRKMVLKHKRKKAARAAQRDETTD